MTALRQYAQLVALHMRMFRSFMLIISIVNIAMAFGLILGFSYIIPDISDSTARFLITGTVTQMMVTIGLVALPQNLSEMKHDGRVEYFFTLPISREAYLLSLVTVAFIQSLPSMVLALLFGAWYFEVSLALDPALVLVAQLAVLSLAGIGVTLAVISPHQQLTNVLTQLIIFYVLFFGPVLLPESQLPVALRHISDFMPTSYIADAIRGSTTDLPGTHLGRSLAVMAAFGLFSMTLSAISVRRRG